MSSALPVSPGPPDVPPDSALGVFDVPGCPACRHIAEASKKYLAWLVAGGYQDADVMQRLSASRGMCAAHTRRVLAEPGAGARLVRVYGHVIDNAVADIGARPATCPACDHVASAADRLFGHMLGEATRGDRRTYKDHGGLCVPHLRRAAVARRGADILWLVRFMIVRLTEESPSLDLVAGHADAAAQLVLPGASGADLATCAVCATGAEAAYTDRDRGPQDCMCAQHLRDVVSSSGCGATALLTEQAALHAARLGQVVDGRARSLGNYLSVRARRALADPDCPLCRSSDTACAREVSRVASALRESATAPSARPALCLRHARDVQAVDQLAGRIAEAYVGDRGQLLLGQLRAAVDSGVGGPPAGSASPAVTAVRRAALFLDGSTFGLLPRTACPGG